MINYITVLYTMDVWSLLLPYFRLFFGSTKYDQTCENKPIFSSKLIVENCSIKKCTPSRDPPNSHYSGVSYRLFIALWLHFIILSRRIQIKSEFTSALSVITNKWIFACLCWILLSRWLLTSKIMSYDWRHLFKVSRRTNR